MCKTRAERFDENEKRLINAPRNLESSGEDSDRVTVPEPHQEPLLAAWAACYSLTDCRFLKERLGNTSFLPRFPMAYELHHT